MNESSVSSVSTYEKLVVDSKGFAILSSLLEELSGINLLNTDKNIILMASRLARIIEKKGLDEACFAGRA